MNTAQFDKYFRFTWAIPLLTLLVLALVLVNEVAHQKSNQSLASLEKIIETRLANLTPQPLAIEAETNHRGYLLSGQETYLKPDNKAMHDASNTLTQAVNRDISLEQNQIRNSLLISRLSIGLGAVLSVLAFLLYLKQARQLVSIELAAKHQLEHERDDLEKEVAERTAKLSELANYLETAREDERAHLARELHDELGALLTAAKLDVARLRLRLTPCSTEVDERMTHLVQSLNAGLALKRRIVEGLRPSSLSMLGLVSTLEILARESAQCSGITIESHLEPVALVPAVELTAYRFVQEALTNLMKYSAAKNVAITLEKYEHSVELSVRDDGVGFDSGKIKSSSYGLASMRQRVEAAGGRMRLESVLGKGTVLTACLPHHTPCPARVEIFTEPALAQS